VPEVPCPLALAPPEGAPVATDHSASAPLPCRPREAVSAMVVSVPLVVIVGAIVFVAWRYMGLRVWQALICLVFGFLLAATTAAPEIGQAITVLVRWLSGSRP
jgi:hypothetical protein